jgi:hypothetical protein
VPLQSNSQFRRSGQRDDRRRRLLADECLGAGASAAERGRAGGQPGGARSRHYGDAAFLDDQLRLLDLVPRSLPGLGAAALVGAVCIAALAALHRWTAARADESIGRIAAFDLAAEANLATWFSSLALLLAAGAAVLVFSVRRYRADDYQGRYRVWLWAAACWFLLATDRAAGLSEALRRMMVYWTGTPLWGDGSIWWLAVYALLLGAVGSRVLLDVWESRLATCLLLAAGVCCLTAVAAGQGWMAAPEGSDVLFEAVAGMSAALGLLLAVLAQARHVVLDAEGLLPQRDDEDAGEPTVCPPGSSPAAIDQAGDAEPDDEEIDERPAAGGRRGWFRVEPAHGKPKPNLRPAGAPTPASPSPAAAQPASVAAAESSVKRKLTKQEKRALKQRLLEARLQRERQQSWGK